jgi:hypothetical protein
VTAQPIGTRSPSDTPHASAVSGTRCDGPIAAVRRGFRWFPRKSDLPAGTSNLNPPASSRLGVTRGGLRDCWVRWLLAAHPGTTRCPPVSTAAPPHGTIRGVMHSACLERHARARDRLVAFGRVSAESWTNRVVFECRTTGTRHYDWRQCRHTSKLWRPRVAGN